MKHTIRKQVIDLVLGDRSRAFAIQTRMSGFNSRTILPALERLFDELNEDGAFVQLPQLTIDLGVIDPRLLESDEGFAELFPGVLANLREEILRHRQQQTRGTAHSVAQQWLYYMEYGILPWNTPTVNTRWKQKVLEIFATDYRGIALLRQLIRRNRNAVIRMVRSHDVVFLSGLAAVLTAKKQDTLATTIRELEQVILQLLSMGNKTPQLSASFLREKLWVETLEGAARETEHNTTEALLTALVRGYMAGETKWVWIKAAEETGARTVAQILISGTRHPGSNSKTHTEYNEGTVDAPEIAKDGIEKDAASSGHDDKQPTPAQSRESMNDMEKVAEALANRLADTDKPAAVDTRLPDLEEGVFVENAGLVLLHPFLTGLLRRTSLTKDDEFVNDATRERAVHLLYFLATGGEDAEDALLAIPKFLLGIPLHQPVTAGVLLTVEEKEETQNLLEAAIGQWAVLKGTSPETLRNTFLQRTGKLYTRNENYHLLVEGSSVDILLDHLPWNLAILKLPWMQDFLRVEWR